MAIEWLNKLQEVTDYQQLSLKLDEARLRNNFLYVLSRYCFQGELFRPFDRPPPGGPLADIKHKLVSYGSELLMTINIMSFD
jgi:hypothetical protein